MAVRLLSVSLLLVASMAPVASQSGKDTAPETFRANGQITDQGTGAAAVISIRIERYTSDAEHAVVADALKQGGHPSFLEALRKAPVVGAVKIGDRSVPIRWARQQPNAAGRRIAVVTESPMFFFGAGAADAKPTAGFDVAVLEFSVDAIGMGKGTMAGAARVKPGGPTGVEVEDYAGKRITLVTVTRDLS